MDLTTRVQGVLNRTEAEIAALAADAMGHKAYDIAGQLVELAQQLRRMGEALQAPPVYSAVRKLAEGVPMSAARSEASITSPTKRVVAGKEYPRFYSEDSGTLVKIGYSKSKRSRYEHRSPMEVLDKLAVALKTLGAGDRLFNTEELFDQSAGLLPAYPTYQTYLCLAFLVHQELLVRFGRQGYRLSPAARADFPGAVRQAFGKLKTK